MGKLKKAFVIFLSGCYFRAPQYGEQVVFDCDFQRAAEF
jgi:hypothetical protein